MVKFILSAKFFETTKVKRLRNKDRPKSGNAGFDVELIVTYKGILKSEDPYSPYSYSHGEQRLT